MWVSRAIYSFSALYRGCRSEEAKRYYDGFHLLNLPYECRIFLFKKDRTVINDFDRLSLIYREKSIVTQSGDNLHTHKTSEHIVEGVENHLRFKITHEW